MGKLCGEADCTNTLRARDLCSTHYNRLHQPHQHRKITHPCGYCGTPTLKEGTGKYIARFCSLICRDLWRIQEDVNPRPPLRVALPKAAPPPRPRRPPAACTTCGTDITGRKASARYCTTCARTRSNQARRIRMRGRRIKRRQDIFERDAWVCHLCGAPTDPHAVVPDLTAPTVDHIVPRSHGGSDHPSNLRTAHFMCNTLRGVRPLAS